MPYVPDGSKPYYLRLRINLLSGFGYRYKGIYKTIDVLSTTTLEELHRIIFFLFERYDEHMWEFHFDKVGRYWGAKAGKTDIVAIDTMGGNLVLGECKYTSSQKGLSELHALQEKSQALLKLTQTKNANYILFSTAGFTKGLIDEAKKNAHIKLIESL